MIHQEPLTFPDLSVAENIFIGRQPCRQGRIDWEAMACEAAKTLESLGVKIDLPRAKVRGLSIADRQMVEMAAALSPSTRRVLLMDETTAALTPSEVKRLFGVMRQTARPGRGIRHSLGIGWRRFLILRAHHRVARRRNRRRTTDERDVD